MKEFIKNFDENKLKEALKIKEAFKNKEIPLDMANAMLKAHVGSLSAVELAYIEQHFLEYDEKECMNEDIKEMMSIYDGVLKIEENKLLDGHPIKNYIDENNKIREVVLNIENLLEKKYIKNQWDEVLENLNTFKVHLSRKQNQLYTALENKGFDRPTTTMWTYDNEVRDRISRFIDLCKEEFKVEFIRDIFIDLKEILFDLMEKEETVLYKVALSMINEKEFLEMISGDKEIGYTLIEPKNDFEMSFKKETDRKSSEVESENKGFKEDLEALLKKYNVSSWNEDTPMNVSTGILSLNQINLLFKHLPVDISYVDENELVAFYSDTKHRVFPRSKGVIGRKVQNCHPKSSVHIVDEIIEKFRENKEDRVEFWINKEDVFIYILYVAIRDEKGNFKGVMEMMQDVSHIRKLEGSQTLLNWGNEEKSKKKEIYRYDNPDMERQEKEEKIKVLSPDIKVEVLFEQYKGLKEYMIKKSDKFAIMKSPMFNVLSKIATVKTVSEKTGISIERLQEEFDIYLKNSEEKGE